MRLLFSVTILLCTASCFAQETPTATPPPQSQLEQLSVVARSLVKDLPSFACVETGLSQHLKKKKTVDDEVRFVADVTVQRVKGGLDEHYAFKELDGKPYNGPIPHAPLFIEGGFAETLLYLLPEYQRCLHFSTSPGRIDFSPIKEMKDEKGCSALGGPTGFLLLDAEGNVTHIERHIPEKAARTANVAPYTSVDLLPAELNGHTYPLPAVSTVDVDDKSDMLHFEARFTGCRLFRATSKILSVDPVAPPPER